MLIDSVDISRLPENAEAAFIEFERMLRAELTDEQARDRDSNQDRNGNYEGTYAPERNYVSSIIAFLDEYNLELGLADVSSIPYSEFMRHFNEFAGRINYIKTRFLLRQKRFEQGFAGTPIEFSISYKEQITSLLNTIRKIVNSEVAEQNKKDMIFKRIAALQLEIDRERTSVDALFNRVLDISKIVGESAENLEPLLDKLERLKRLIFEGSVRPESLPGPRHPKQITDESQNSTELDDDIPF